MNGYKKTNLKIKSEGINKNNLFCIKTKFIVVIIIILLFLLCRQRVFTVFDQNENVVKYIQKVNIGDKIEFNYIHSVSKTPITETLEIQNGVLALNKVEYIDQGGAGMPEFPRGKEVFEVKDGKYIISNFDRKFKQIPIRVQEDYKDELTLNNENIKLYQIIENNKVALIETKKVPFIMYIYYKFRR